MNGIDVPPKARRQSASSQNAGSEAGSFVSEPKHLSESYSRPVFVLGSRPLLFTQTEEPLPPAFLTREERNQFENEEQTLLENNDILPNPQHHLQTVLEGNESVDEAATEDGTATETTSLIRPTSGTAESRRLSELTRAQKLQTWEDAVSQNQLQTTWKYEAKLYAMSSPPMIATFILQYSMQFASIFSLGHLGRLELAAASLASMTASISLIAFAQGTLYALRASAPVNLISLPLVFLREYLSEFEAATGDRSPRLFVSPRVICWSVLSPFYIFDRSNKVLDPGNFRVSSYALFVAAPVNAILNYVLVWHPRLGFGFAGAPAAMSVSYWLMLVQMLFYVKYGSARHSWHGFTWAAFKGWKPMISLAVPGCLMTCTEWWAYEVIAFASSLVGVVPLGAQAILSTTGSTTYQLPFAVAVAVSARVGNLLGAGLAGPARQTAYVSFGIAILCGLAIGIFTVSIRNDWGRLFSSDEAVIQLAARVLPYTALFNIADSVQVVTAGILRGQGQQHLGGILNLAGYYVVAIPLGLVLCFKAEWGLQGLWTGMIVAIFLIAGFQSYFVLRCDWESMAESIRLRHGHGATLARQRTLE